MSETRSTPVVFNLQKLLSKREDILCISPEREAELAAYYRKKLAKYGYLEAEGNAEAITKGTEFMANWWAWGKGECSAPTKSLFFFGTRGVGKTLFFKIFSGLFEVEMISVWELAKVFSVHGYEGFWNFCDSLKYKHLIIDDLGNEADVKSYGNEMPVADLLRFREDYFRSNGTFTFFTSNLTDNKRFREIYGDTVWSRVAGMCEFVRITGSDKRTNTD